MTPDEMRGRFLELLENNFCTCCDVEPFMAVVAPALDENERLRAELAELPTDLLHPDFGTEWREPDGVIYKAVAEKNAENIALRTVIKQLRSLCDRMENSLIRTVDVLAILDEKSKE